MNVDRRPGATVYHSVWRPRVRWRFPRVQHDIPQFHLQRLSCPTRPFDEPNTWHRIETSHRFNRRYPKAERKKGSSSYVYPFEKHASKSRMSFEDNFRIANSSLVIMSPNLLLPQVQAGRARYSPLYRWAISRCIDGDMAYIICRWRCYLPQEVILFRADRGQTGRDIGIASSLTQVHLQVASKPLLVSKWFVAVSLIFPRQV